MMPKDNVVRSKEDKKLVALVLDFTIIDTQLEAT